MKKFLVIFNLLISIFCYADFVSIDLTGQNIPVDKAVSYFGEWFEIGNSEFVLFFDETDELGFRDQDYQQYFNGIKVENCALYVHSSGGYVTLINGDIMPIQSKPTTKSQISVKEARKKARVSEDTNAERTFIHETESDGDTFYEVYKILTDTADIYVDVESGKVIRILSRLVSATACNVTTKYKGTQTIYCEKVDNEYLLRNDTKNLRTCFANMGDYNSYPSYRYSFKNSTTNWNNSYLTSVTINAVHDSWWDIIGEDPYPDLYIRIKDASGAYVYTSDYKLDCGQKSIFPVIFYISKRISVPENGEVVIEVYDQDAIKSDTKGFTINVNTNSIGTYTFGSSTKNVEGSIAITTSHPAFDVQWGLEKVYDFYKNKFNLAGFNGQTPLLRAFLHNNGGVDYIKNEQPDYPKLGVYNNAYASGDPEDPTTAHLFFGIGNEIGNSEVGLNTVTHEFTHLVTKYRPKGQLVYQGESGALNEGYSDVMAIAHDVYLYGSTDWLYDKEVMMKINGVQYGYMRNLKNPKAGGPEGPQPDTYGKDPWVDPTDTSEKNDIGGVHVNNSIFSHWFYILCEGKTGVNDNQHSYSVSPIGMEKALKIIWRMHRTYLPAQSTFAQARKWAIQSAKELYPSDKNILRTVTDAWYAVGVGDKYKEVVCKSVPYTETFAASQGDFTIYNLTLPSGFTSIWNWDSQYGLVAKCIKGSTKYKSESWLISPCVELPANESCTVSFSHAAKFFESTSQMSMWISTNFDESALDDVKWVRLSIPNYPTGTNWNWYESGDIDLSAYKGQSVNIAFCYKSNTSYAPQWEIKNFSVKKSDLMSITHSKFDDQPRKLLRDGQIYIRRGEKIYTIQGQEVR